MDEIVKTMAYTFKRVDESCYKDLVFLYESAFNQNTTIAYYQHKMDTGYLGVKHLGYLAYTESGEPAAFYGVFPYPMEYNGKFYLAAQSGDTMTSPAHGGKGLFTTLAKMTYDLAKAEGIQFIFGFPNDNSYPGFVKKLSWEHKENMTNYEWKVNTLPLAGIAKKIALFQPVYSLYSKFVLGLFKSSSRFLPSSVAGLNVGSVRRSKGYFTYKSFYNNHLVKVADKDIWVKTDGALLVGDMEISREGELDKMILGIRRLAFWLGCNKIIFPVSKGVAWDILLKDKVTSKEGIYIGYLDLQSGLPLENFKFVFADFDTF